MFLAQFLLARGRKNAEQRSNYSDFYTFSKLFYVQCLPLIQKQLVIKVKKTPVNKLEQKVKILKTNMEEIQVIELYNTQTKENPLLFSTFQILKDNQKIL